MSLLTVPLRREVEEQAVILLRAAEDQARAELEGRGEIVPVDSERFLERYYSAGLVMQSEDDFDVADAAEWDLAGRAAERRAQRELAERRRGFSSRSNCGQCGRFKSNPADRCDHCGEHPVTVGEDAGTYNRSCGAAW